MRPRHELTLYWSTNGNHPGAWGVCDCGWQSGMWTTTFAAQFEWSTEHVVTIGRAPVTLDLAAVQQSEKIRS